MRLGALRPDERLVRRLDPDGSSAPMVTERLTSKRLTEERIEAMRARFPYQMPVEWVGKIASREGWREANSAYLAAERKRSAAAMQHLMSELGVDHPRSRAEALDLIEIAFEVFACGDDFDGTITRDGDKLLIEVRSFHIAGFGLLKSRFGCGYGLFSGVDSHHSQCAQQG